MGHKFKSLGKLSNGWTDLHQTWHTCTDSSENGYTPNKLPLETQGWHLGVLGGQTFKSLGKQSNGWTDWHQLWYTSAESSGNGHRLITSCPSISQGAFGRGGGLGVTNSKVWGSCQTAGPICTKLGIHVQIHLRMAYAQQIAPRDTMGAFGGF